MEAKAISDKEAVDEILHDYTIGVEKEEGANKGNIFFEYEGGNRTYNIPITFEDYSEYSDDKLKLLLKTILEKAKVQLPDGWIHNVNVDTENKVYI